MNVLFRRQHRQRLRMPVPLRQALAEFRAQIEADYAAATRAIESGHATPWDTGRHYQCDRAARYLMDAGLWE